MPAITLPRRRASAILAALDRQAATALLGPRQVGKTTLALAIGASRPAIYLDLESAVDRARLADPGLFFDSVADRLVILDEIHRMPEIFALLRGVIDRGRHEGRRTGRFLILGSAGVDLLRQSSETLAGRIAFVDLGPFSVLEIAGERASRERLWVRGGFPDSYLAASDADSFAWRSDFIRIYLERDVPLFGARVPAETLGRLWTMLAHRQGGFLNASDLARALEVSHQSVTRYIDLLCDLLLVRRLPPYSANIGKRMVRSPKVYIRDSGLVHALLGLDGLHAISGHPVAAASWEGFAIETLVAELPPRSRAYTFRTAGGAEIDLLIEWADGRLWAVEIKRSLAPRVRRGFRQACADLAPARAFIVHAGDDRYPLGPGLEAIDLRTLAAELATAT